MSKYTYEQKVEICEAYLRGEGGFRRIAEKYLFDEVKHAQVKIWVRTYEKLGKDYLKQNKTKSKFSLDFKISVVKLYLTEKKSYLEIALSQGLSDPSLVRRWVKEYRNHGPNFLLEKRKGRKPTMEKDKELRDLSAEEKLKQLEKENLHLRIQNKYLKELRRLRLEEEAKNRELLVVSEESLD